MAGLSSNEDDDILQIIRETLNISLSDECFTSLTHFTREFQCPFTWKECSDKIDDIKWVKILKWKFSERTHDYRIFYLSLLLGCVQSRLKDQEAAQAAFDNSEKILKRLKNEKFFVDIIEGLEHVLFSSKLFFLKMTDRNFAAEEILPRIKFLGEMKKESQAALFSLKAVIIRIFGDDAKLEALRCAKLAMKLDPDDLGHRRGAYYYLTGKILNDIRLTKSCYEMPLEEELQMLERSLLNDPFPSHIWKLADSYAEVVKTHSGSFDNDSKLKTYFNTEMLLRKTKEMYEACVNHKSASALDITRGGMGLMKLPRHLVNLELAEEAFQRAMELGNGYAAIGMGLLLNWFKHDHKEALKYFEKAYSAKTFSAGLEIVKVKHKIDVHYDPVEDCDRFLKDLESLLEVEIYNKLSGTYRLIKAEYLLVKRKDLLSAVQEWKIVMDQCRDSDLYGYILSKTCSIWGNRHTELCNLISLEIRKALAQRQYVGNDENFIRKILEELPPECRNYQEKVMSWRHRE